LSRKYGYFPVLIASRFSEESIVKNVQNKLKDITNKSGIEIGLFLGYEFDLPKYLMQYKRVKFLINVPTDDFCPLVPYEAELIGHKNLVVINSNIKCFTSVISDMHNGFLVSPNVSAIVKKVETISNLSDVQRQDIIKKGKQRAKKIMNLKRNYLKSIKFLTKI